MQELILFSNQRIKERFNKGHFVSSPLNNKSFSNGVKNRYKNKIENAKLRNNSIHKLVI
jgi:hypothetical protein